MATQDHPTDSFDEILRALDHDVRNPVANILGFVDLLREAPGAAYSAEQLEFLDRIDDNCRVLLRLMDRLRVVVRPHG
jgi:signal transduction histidine kinase